VRKFALDRQNQWRWWDREGAPRRRPAAAMTVLKPGMPFETGVPESGAAMRIRMWADNTGQARPKEARAELLTLKIDGHTVEPKLVSTETDRYAIYHVADAQARLATAQIRIISTGQEITMSASLEE
jgi:hypothetical protein